MTRPNRFFSIIAFLCVLVTAETNLLVGEEQAKAHVAVIRVLNETGQAPLDAACKAATDTLLLSLRQIGHYVVQKEEQPLHGEEGLRVLAEQDHLDFIMYGRMTNPASGGIEFSLSIFDRAKGKISLSRSKKAAGALDIFDATDQLVVSVLESMTGAHIGFGSIDIRNIGEKGSFAVLVDGYPEGRDLESLDRVLIGAHTLTIVQKRMLGERVVAKSDVKVKEGSTAAIQFAIPYFMDDEKARIDELKADIAAGWNDPAASAAVDNGIAKLVSLFGDVLYSPRLSAYKEEASQLAGEWGARRSRVAIENSAWEPKLELLDAGEAKNTDVKVYLDPEKIRKAFEENALLVATLFELKAGKALGEGNFTEGLECFGNALMVSTRNLGGKRMKDYAYAITILQNLQDATGTAHANSGNAQSLKTIFGDVIRAGQRFYALRDQFASENVSVIVASDFKKMLSVDGDDLAEAPLALQPDPGSRIVRIRAEGTEKSITLMKAAGFRILFAQDGFSPFGKTETIEVKNPGIGMGTLNISSDPPGVSIAIDDGDAVITPTSLELVPGAHSFEPKNSLVKGTYYLGQPKQWIAVSAGTELSIPLRIRPAAASLELSLVPDGYTLFVNDEKMGVTPIGPMKVKAGIQTLRFEKEGYKTINLTQNIEPDKTVTLPWGYIQGTVVTLKQKMVNLDGTPDSWAGLEPIYESANGTFMGDSKYGIKKFYMCRDDKYLYWRLDFQEQSPFWHFPKGSRDGISGQLSIQFEPQKQLNIGMNYNPWVGTEFIFLTVVDKAKGEKANLPSDPVSYKNSKTMLTGKVEFSKIATYCKGGLIVRFNLWNSSNNGQDSHADVPDFYIDFSK